MAARITPDSWVDIGLVGKPKGLDGLVWFRSFSADAAVLREGLTLRLTLRNGTVETRTLEAVGEASGKLMVAFAGLEDRTAAEALTGATAAAQRRDFAPLDEGEFYHCDLEGVDVFDAEGARVGAVLRVAAYPSVDALVIETARGEVEVPVVDALVLSLDVAAGRVVIAPEALLSE
ncbi:MAG: 16S rRNA processing protein RimM [Myxococcales bacterium]|jgi:16S rRNA processing protein RimM|nr:16S rRNA processing protein RimM [Myxococcales bacterium]